MPDTHTARDALRRAVAAEFQRLDAHDWGYDHGFCADPDSDEETAAFVDAAIRIVLNAAADHLTDSKTHLGCTGCAGGLLFAIGKVRRLAAAPTTPTTKEK